MHLNEFLEQLIHGPVQNVFLDLKGNPRITSSQRNAIINYVNQGLRAICSKFPLVRKELVVELKENITLYRLTCEHTVSACKPDDPTAYIIDSEVMPFQGDLVKILQVFDNHGCEVPLNEHGNPASVYTPSFSTLQIPCGSVGDRFRVIYQAYNTRIGDDCCCTFDLPPLLVEALIAYVSHKIYRYINGDANRAIASEFMATFEACCAEAADKDLTATSQNFSNNKLSVRGFI